MADPNAVDTGRRAVLAAALAAALPGSAVARAHSVTELSAASAPAAESEDEDVFPQGVASGDPTPTGAVLWTRIASDAYREETALTATVARDEGLTDIVGSWRVPAERVAGGDYTVKVDLDGELDPDRNYYYRFAYDGASSPVGRCRTLPAPDASPDRVAFALLTCQDYRNGYYGAYHHVAQADVDFLVHLGDFIYEHGGGSAYDGRSLSLPSGEGVVMGLDDFRYLHRTYRTDRFLREALAAHPILQTWDDHEIVNNRYWDYEEGRPYAGDGDHPRNDDPEFMTRLFADGIRAWWEYTPTRVPYDPDADSLLDQLELWRGFRFGDLVELLVTDERLYRTAPADGAQFEAEIGAAGGEITETMLGETQREWFTGRLAESDATWTAWANEVLAMEFDLDLGGAALQNADAWDAFAAERDLLLERAAAGDGSFVALTGDMHTALAGYIEGEDRRYGVEFMTPAVTSVNLRELLELPDERGFRELLQAYVQQFNPHVEFFDSHDWGYATVEFTPEDCTYSAYAVDKTDDSADADRRLLARYRCPADEYALQRLE
ncbi:alkaline phosphatase D family protein [Halomicroarcula limicola]|uniref:Alkaline phosphatase D family protein n=1 Tax=Haloarcula limicola TaxID=1429915 RepID=A0A8J7Y6E6_9EURY|nr:alkaline phosphatase D family protein [Halomicroarcula limicola]MBV0925112.1 alkaline phosphatase D family protein [Halomicroarcula limicola]